MAFWRPLVAGLRALVRGRAADRDVDDEVRQYVEEATRAGIASGLSPESARGRAMAEIGSVAAVREQVRSSGWERVIVTAGADVRYAFRRLRHAPGFTATIVVTLGLGIGASTAIFSAIHPILVEPLPYPEADHLQSIHDRGPGSIGADVTFGTYRELSERLHTCSALAVMKAWKPTLSADTGPERLDGQAVSAGYFGVLAVHPRLGRDFSDAEDRPDGPRVVILSDSFWQRRFNGDVSLIGRAIPLDGVPFTVVGVMPPAFENVTAPTVQVWTTMQYDTALPIDGREWGHHLRLIARMRSSASVGALTRELDDISRHPVASFARPPWASLRTGLSVVPLQEEVTADVRGALLALGTAVLLLLVLACVNVTNLVLMRAVQRRGEIAVRTALGAGRARIARQLITETLVLGVLGGGAGLLAANLGVGALVALSPVSLPRVDAIGISGPVFLFALGLAMAVGIVVGLVPAIQALRGHSYDLLRHPSFRSTPAHHGIRRTLAAAQIALAVVLLVSSGLLYRSVKRLFAIEPGFDAHHVVVMQVHTWGRRYGTEAALERFFEAARDAVTRVPGVDAAAFTNQLPLSGDNDQYGVGAIEESARRDSRSSAYRYVVLPGYFEAMQVPIRRGRTFTPRDGADAPNVTIVSESLARARFGTVDPLGRRVVIGDQTATVVGIVADVRQMSLAATDREAVYLPAAQVTYPERSMWLVARGQGDVAALAPALRAAIQSVDSDQPITRISTLDDVVARSAGERRFALLVFGAFAVIAIVLAAVGMYGVLAASVTERSREFGLRAALGASPADVLRMVVRDASALATAGLIAGVAGASLSSRLLVTLLFGTSRTDPLTYISVGLLLAGVAAVATLLPARRAIRLDPAVTLRME